MTKHLVLIATALLGLAAPAVAQTRALPPGEIRANGDITFGNALTLGKRDAGKTIITPDTLQILGPGSTGDVSGMSATPQGATRARSLASKLTDAGVSVLDFGPSVGTGGDDSAAINAAITRAVSGPTKAGKVLFPTPPAGYYNVCASPVELPGGDTHLSIEGAVGSGTRVRLLPGCTSGITSVLHQTHNTAQSSRVRVNNMVFDGRCRTEQVANIEYAVGWTAQNTIFRNAAAGGSTVYLAKGYEFSIGDGNRIENVNDPDNKCYNTTADLPDYALRTRSTDSYFTGAIIINAKIATVFNENGGGNNYTGTHVWGYPANAFGQGGPDSRPQYGFLINGNAHLTASIADNFTVAGYYLRNSQFGSKAKLIGSNCIGSNSDGAACILLADGLDSVTVIANNVQGVSAPATNGIRKEGALAGASIIRNNAGAGFETPISLTNVIGGDTLRLESFGAGGGGAIQAQSPGANSSLFLTAKGSGSVTLQSNGATAFNVFNPPNAVNRLQASGSIAGQPSSIAASGSDANIAAVFVGKGTSGALVGGFVRAGAPTTADVPAQQCVDWSNTADGTFKRWCNFGGTLRSITYQ